MRLTVVTLLLLSAPTFADAHHSTVYFDRTQIIEAEGEVTDVAWSNPHIRFTVTGVDDRGEAQVWEIETDSVSTVSRFGLTADLISPGTPVRIAGNPSSASDDAMWLTNMLLPNAQEILFNNRVQARWSGQTIGEDTRDDITADPSGQLGIFRVWTHDRRGGMLFARTDYPLTAAAETARANFDVIRDDPTANCAPKGMPHIMEQPYPMQFVEDPDVILLKTEEYDSVRRINMAENDQVSDPPASLLGHSVGRWDGDTLIVNTTAIDYPFVNSQGIPQSAASEVEERFTLNDDGSQLNYEMTVTDPANFTEPVTLTKYWTWRPGEEVRPYNCIP